MSGRPKNPDWIVEPFAPDLNYAVGALPWNGTPTKTVWAGAPSDGFTPKMGVPAQALNYLFNAAATNDQNAKDAIDALVNWTGQLPALNWTNAPSFADTFSAYDPHGAYFNPVDRKWFVTGGEPSTNSLVTSTFNRGVTWTASLVASIDAGEFCTTADYAANGDMIVATTRRYVFMRLGGTWSKEDAYGADLTGVSSPRCLHDPVSGNYVAVVGLASAQPKLRTSSDGTTWATHGVPFGIGVGGAGPMSLRVRKDTGRILWVATNATAEGVVYSWSDNGGVTWNGTQTMGTPSDWGLGTLTQLSLVYNETTDRWLMFAGEVSGTPSCKVYESADDGETWTLKATLTSSSLAGVSFAVCGPMYIATAKDATFGASFIVYSTDGGATWQRTSQGLSSSFAPLGVFGDASSGFVALAQASNGVYFSDLVGEPGLGVLA